ncbi:MAG TPA: alpha/beta hydrolase [Alphaproteobacteria bacterium]|nr:alpha/beta hydrolase [Alphaproteobacteria bacterium]
MTGPTSRFYVSQRLRMHYVDWGNEDAPTLLLVHGGRDHCRNWDWIAQALKDEYHIIAPDLRGHGDSQWAIGGSYALGDFVYDLAQLLKQKTPGPVSIVSHSMGGAISLMYAGTFPELVNRLVVIEGIIMSPSQYQNLRNLPLRKRFATWIDQLRELSGRTPRKYKSIEEALQRMRDENPHLSPEQARHLTIHGVNQNEDGTFSWKFDNYVRAFAPYGFSAEEITTLWSEITCPTLLVHGQDSWLSKPQDNGALGYFKTATTATIPHAGHWVHHDRLDDFLAIVRPFLKS